MKKQVIENFEEWIFEAAAPASSTVPAGYVRSKITGEELNAKSEVTKDIKGWKSFKKSDSMQVSKLNTLSAGIASDKISDFDSASNGALIMSPVIYKGDGSKLSFVVGFPFSQDGLEGEKSKNITLSQKYLLFAPFDGDKSNVTSPATVGAQMKSPYNFRLISSDSLNVALQSMLWIMGLNNAEQAKKFFATLSKENALKLINSGMEGLKQIQTIANANETSTAIFNSYNDMVSSDKTLDIIFNFASAAKNLTKDDLKNELNLGA